MCIREWVSGAYFGDKMSPLSDTTNLAPIAAGSKLYDHIGHMFYTTIPGCIICIIVYTIAGFSAAGGGTVATPEKVETILTTLEILFRFNPLVIFTPLIVLYGSIRKKPTNPVRLTSSGVAFFNATVFQGFSLQLCFTAAISGFSLDLVTKTGYAAAAFIPDIPENLESGGLLSMFNSGLIAL